MDLILLRHGKAEDANMGGDLARVLFGKEWIAPTGRHAIAQGIALGREIPKNPSPEGAKSGMPTPEEFRPFRATPFSSTHTQGDALGYHILPRWGNPAQRFSQNRKRGGISNSNHFP